MLQRKTSLTRTAGPKRTGRLKPRSAKMQVRQTAKNAAYDHVREAEWCPCCGRPGECSPSHVLTTGLHEKHEADSANILALCWNCHQIWENHKPKFKELYPAMWAQKMRAMRDVSLPDFIKFQALHPVLFEAPAGSLLTTEGDSRPG